MNPHTLLALADAVGSESRHVIDICFLTRLSPTTIYRAWHRGWLEQLSPGVFWSTDALLMEVRPMLEVLNLQTPMRERA